MKRNRLRLLLGAAGAGALLPVVGCGDLVRENLVSGLEEGAITTTTGLINAYFETTFGADGGAEGENGNDLFVRL